VCAKSLKVLVLGGVVGVVPVTDVDEVDRVRGQAVGPVDQLRQRSGRRLGPEQAGRFRIADVEQVGQWIVGADRVDKVTL